MAHVPQVNCTWQRFALLEGLVVDCAWGVTPPILYILCFIGLYALLVLCYILRFDYMVVLLGLSKEALICAIFNLLLGYGGIFYSRLRTSGFS